MSGISVLMAAEAPNDLSVVLLGLGMVFVGLIIIILICSLTGRIFSSAKKSEAEPIARNIEAIPDQASPAQDIPDRGRFIAAVSAAIAEDMGTDVSAIRIVSVKKV